MNPCIQYYAKSATFMIMKAQSQETRQLPVGLMAAAGGGRPHN